MKRHRTPIALAITLALAAGSLQAGDGGGKDVRFSARLEPTREVPALSSVASGRIRIAIDDLNQTITYELSYQNLEGDALQAHIHIGQPDVNGGVSVFLCGNAPTVPPASVPQPPACPTPSGTIEGVLTPANIIGPAGQGIAPTTASVNEFTELVRAIREGITYTNVHSSKFPGGEVRGQLTPARGRGRHAD